MDHPIATKNGSPENYSTGLKSGSADLPNDDLVVNGNFATDTDWTKGAGWAISAGAAHTPGNTADLSQTIADLDLNTAYLVVTTITGRAAGTVTPKIGTNAGAARGADETYYDIIQAQSTDLIYTPTTDFDGTITQSRAIKVLEAQVVLPNAGKNGQGVLYSLHGHNNLGVAQYIMIFKLGAAADDGDIPFRSIMVAANDDYKFDLPVFGDHSLNGFYVCNSTTNFYKTLGAADCTFVAQYK
jgi:hypothetical protein